MAFFCSWRAGFIFFLFTWAYELWFCMHRPSNFHEWCIFLVKFLKNFPRKNCFATWIEPISNTSFEITALKFLKLPVLQGCSSWDCILLPVKWTFSITLFSFLFNWNCCGFYVFFCWSESSLWFSGLYESCVGQWILVKAKNMTQNRDEPPAVRVYTICDESRLVCIIIWDCSWDESNSYEYFNPNHLNSFNTSSLYRYLIVRNVPALGCGDDLLNLFASYGDIEE